ncbi:Hemolysin secretion protein D, chromosomal [Aquimixticola soesokkakensis]|uniref:Membrane fusion protein (MFP) family protein n=1 Tax=Aquimixticola soesokkakensis TaxID=1519096 RepID=A0A1Y5TQA7_9RHOB|nr:HlyD family type I secretion periplasmic adaptor subunit [Aquimixticola soesokkakensis]SLN69397.1 Hemolysin secretion protein D, chromosomal [Aquimixticola soesokkakensis]
MNEQDEARPRTGFLGLRRARTISDTALQYAGSETIDVTPALSDTDVARLPPPPQVPQTASRRARHLRHLAESARLEERPDHFSLRFAIWGISGSLLATLVWTAFATLPEVARGTGQIMPQSFERELVHRESGRILALNTGSGDVVKAGDVIARLDDDAERTQLSIAQSMNLSLRLRIERLSAFVEERTPDFGAASDETPEVLQAQQAYRAMKDSLRDQTAIFLDQIDKNIRDRAILERQIAAQTERLRARQDLLLRREELFEKKLVIFPEILEARQSAADAQADLDILTTQLQRNLNAEQELLSRVSSLTSTRKADARQQLQQAYAELSESEARILGMREGIERKSIRAPVDGVLKLPDRLAVGDFVSAGQPLGYVVPQDDPLVARIRIPAREISNIYIGQPVDLKITSLDFIRFGKVSGTIASLSPAASVSETGDVYYGAEVDLERDDLVLAGKSYPLLPGMVVSAEIINGSRTVLAYLFKPVKVALEDAFKES